MYINLDGMFFQDTFHRHSMLFLNDFLHDRYICEYFHSDAYVHSKLGDRDWIPSQDRCQLCKGAIESEHEEISSWIGVSYGESEWPNGFVDFGPVAEKFRDFLNYTLVGPEKLFKYPLRVVYVCGLDHYNKCSYVEYMAKQKNMACAVVCRVGYNEQQVARSIRRLDVIYIPLSKEHSKLPDVSSTQIRRYFEKPSTSNTYIERYIY